GSLLTVLFVSPTPTTAETLNCTAINSVPTVITAPGIYCLTKDLTTAITTGSAIEIQTNNVVIDLNSHRLGGGAAGLGTSDFGIQFVNGGSGKYRDNLTASVPMAYSGGTDAGNNN